jgi:hypothetical protein
MGWACFLPVHGNYPLHVLPGLLLMPVGYGMSFPSAYAAASSAVPARQADLASGLITTAADGRRDRSAWPSSPPSRPATPPH